MSFLSPRRVPAGIFHFACMFLMLPYLTARAGEEDFVALTGNADLQRIETQLPRFAASDATILITGPSGSGKEILAARVHQMSRRSNGPYVAINMAAISPTLVASELFGHVKGAFTGAASDRAGLFEQANGGTIFLDEIGDMPPDQQAKLLRVLENRTVVRVGSSKEITVNIRIIAATNANLIQAVEQGKFREDLFYRLSVIQLMLPPLREHPSDIFPLAEFFLRRWLQKNSGQTRTFSAEIREWLTSQSWGGNIRELRNAVEYAAVMSETGEIHPSDFPEPRPLLVRQRSAHPIPEGFVFPRETIGLATLGELTASYCQHALLLSSGNRDQAALRLGIQRSQLETILGLPKTPVPRTRKPKDG